MTFFIDRKSLNENDYCDMRIEKNDTQEVISPSDDVVVELLYEVITKKDKQK